MFSFSRGNQKRKRKGIKIRKEVKLSLFAADMITIYGIS